MLKPSPTQSPSADSSRRVGCGLAVARFLDGRTLKGRTFDFACGNPEFRMIVEGETSPTTIEISELKAVFFVEDLEGSGIHGEYAFKSANTYEPKAVVKFSDGEIIPGTVIGYGPDKPGFILIPAQRRGNNHRVYVPMSAVRLIRWID